MQNRPIKGTQGWTQHSIVLDVDRQGDSRGVWDSLERKGAVWIDDLAFDVVGEDVPVTDVRLHVEAAPRNLDFENTPERR